MNVPVPGLMDKLSRIKNSPITHDVLFESAGKKDEFAKALVSLVGPIVAQPGCIGAGVFETWPKRDGLQGEKSDVYGRMAIPGDSQKSYRQNFRRSCSNRSSHWRRHSAEVAANNSDLQELIRRIDR